MRHALVARPGSSLIVASGLSLLIALGVWLAVARASHRAPSVDPASMSQTALEQKTGVRLVRLATTGQGGLLDLRFQVIDPEKAYAVHQSRPAIIDERSKLVVDQPLMGHLPFHNTQLQAGHTYYVIYTNPGDTIKPGSRVTIVLGGARLQHVTVG